jgi:hybrid cluster-associated redox disulfide protein
MEVAALIIAVLALFGAFLATRRAASVQERLELTTGELRELRTATNATLEELQNKLNQLQLQARRQAGQPIFEPRMTIAEAMGVHPKVAEVLEDFHLGGCSHCAVSDVDTIEGACQTYGIDQAALMNALNSLVSGGSGGSTGLVATVHGARISNVKVSN